jgi:Protein of unknown function (DUF1203)
MLAQGPKSASAAATAALHGFTEELLMRFRVTGLDPARFQPLFAMSDAELAGRCIERVRVAEKPGAPCRISLDDAEIGEQVLLLNYTHQPAETPYHQQGPIFVRDTASRFVGVGAVPPALACRPLSLRGYDASHGMIEADLCDGAGASETIGHLFENPAVVYIHAHYARRGCFAAVIERA